MKRCNSVDAEESGKIMKLEVPLTLNEQQQKIYNYLTSVDCFEPIFVSGSAGTGKSALLVTLTKAWTMKNMRVDVGTYTNLAARNVNGKTLHKLFGFDLKMELRSNFCFNAPDYLIIDEISMVPDKMLAGIDERLQQAGLNGIPFGGVNVVVFGDLFQLPPISNDKDAAKPPYYASVWSSFKLYELTINMRQSEQEFIDALNKLRVGDLTCQKFFNKQVLKKPPSIAEKLQCTSLVSTHKEADFNNNLCYNHIKKNKDEKTIELKEQYAQRFKHDIVYNANQEKIIFKDGMKYCVGTRVMITQTVPTTTLCNGDIGEIVSIDDEKLTFQRECDGQKFDVCQMTINFETSNYHTMKCVTGLTICQAWAVTIHKAQGMTLKNLIVYPERTFVEGQAYVALSRVTHCDGLKLVNKIPDSSIIEMRETVQVYKNLERLSLE
uniref:ORF105 protein n=1 Tax=Plutella xylostella granulovirus TaxID=98383 RepID=A0A7U3U8B0_9BBAC|nr:ORF105 protein [Plutella xylostella granulovirus]QKV50148.1 ORF105 protein [Plutella xylostella granulovirus]